MQAEIVMGMRNLYVLLGIGLVLFGCLGGGQPTAQPTVEQKYSSLAAAEYTLEYPESYKKESVSFADGVFYSGKATFVVSKLQAESTDLFALGTELFDQLDAKYTIERADVSYLNNGEINYIGGNEWFVLCYNTAEDKVNDNCVALTLCNSKQVVMNLVVDKGGLEGIKTDFVHALESFKCG